MSIRSPRQALVLLALPALVVAMDQNVLFLALPTLTDDLGLFTLPVGVAG